MARSVLRVSFIVEFLRVKVHIMWFGRAKGGRGILTIGGP